MRQKMKNTIVLTMIACFLSGCADRYSGDVYQGGSVGEVSKTVRGVIIDKRKIVISEASKGLNEGAAIGGVTGGLLGSTVGQGRGSLVAGVLGALAGGAAGQMTSDSLQSQDGFEYQIELMQTSTMNVPVHNTHHNHGNGRNVTVVNVQSGPNSRTVHYDHGEIITVTQGIKPDLAVGQNVLVIYSGKRSRVVPDNSRGYMR
jgi:outer membrane lipoprotein SlyB